jgi:subtilase family serine protease
MAAAIACAASMPGAADAATTSGNVAGWVKNATKIGAASGNLSVDIAVHMSLRNSAGLKALVAEVSSPASKEYGHYLTKEEFGARFAPAASEVDAVKAMLEHAGMSDVQVGPHGVYVSATATVKQLRKTFGVSQDLYLYKGKTLRANREEATIPAALAGKIVYVEGLDDTAMLRTPFHRSISMGELVAPAAVAKSTGAPSVTPPPVAANNPSPYCNKDYGADALVGTLSTAADVYGAAIPWLNCGYTPQQIRAAYGLNKVKYNGKGITVAITDAYASPTLLADSNRYAANHGLPKLKNGENFSQIIPLGIYDVNPNEACGPYGWWTEQSLDMAAVHGSAPGANIVYVGSRDCMTSLDIAFFNTLYNHVADIVTSSWGNNGESIAPGSQGMYDQAAMAGAAQGITVLFSSGDDGDLAALNGVASGSWPATSAWVTGVGGTTLEIMDNGTKAEYGWGTYRAFLNDVTVHSAKSVTTSGLATVSNFGYTYDDFSFYAGSGGGISLLERQPAYQARVVPEALATTLNLASGSTEPLPSPMRVSPDVAMVGDAYTGYLYGETFTIAGNPISDAGCKPISKTEEYCEGGIGGTSLSSPLMAGVIAVMNQKRAASGEPLVGFANPLLYSVGSRGNGVTFDTAPINQIVAPPEPVSVLRGYAANLHEMRVVTINSVPFNITIAPYALFVCGLPVCLGINDVWNYTSLSSASFPPTPAGYNDVTGLGVPYVPKLINEE